MMDDETPGSFELERAKNAKEDRQFRRKMYFICLIVFFCIFVVIKLAIWEPLVLGAIGVWILVTVMFTMIFYTTDVCPRCFGRLEPHKTHPNAYVCTKCHYLKVHD